jgi:hypothetical protein
MKNSYLATHLMVLFDRDGRILAGVPVHDGLCWSCSARRRRPGGRAFRFARGRARPPCTRDRRGPAVHHAESGHAPSRLDGPGFDDGLKAAEERGRSHIQAAGTRPTLTARAATISSMPSLQLRLSQGTPAEDRPSGRSSTSRTSSTPSAASSTRLNSGTAASTTLRHTFATLLVQ